MNLMGYSMFLSEVSKYDEHNIPTYVEKSRFRCTSMWNSWQLTLLIM